MFNIKDFLKRFSVLKNSQIAFREVVSASIRKNAGIDVPLHGISIRSRTILLKGLSPGARSVVFIKKQAILGDIDKNQSGYIIDDIQ